jgi:hypothetical protein
MCNCNAVFGDKSVIRVRTANRLFKTAVTSAPALKKDDDSYDYNSIQFSSFCSLHDGSTEQLPTVMMMMSVMTSSEDSRICKQVTYEAEFALYT